ncbi:MAG TPA: alpha/beta hydrolase [Acidimicrobiales bacterium]|nr:alpha/beta hydrolase [Acidimicrobiales bacterium]
MWTDRDVTLADGTTVTYVDAGIPDGEVVLYLHGTPSSRLQVSGPVDVAASELGLRLVAPDRPGLGGSSFFPYRVADYPGVIERLADALGIDRFGVVGTSGGGRYTAACGALLGDRIRRVGLVASTVSMDVPGARAAANRDDRVAYVLATRVPWLLRAWMAKLARDLRRDPDAFRRMMPTLSEADERAFHRADVRSLIGPVLAETFRQGTRGLTHDYRLEALPWEVRLAAITAPVDIWHGTDDTLVRPDASELLAAAIPGARRHLVDGEGHFSLILARAKDYLAPFAPS